MTSPAVRRHDRFVELAATAIDFPLTPPEADELATHLAACPACARMATALRADAAVLGRPMAVVPSHRVDAAIDAAITGRRQRPGVSRTVVVVAAALLLLAVLLAIAAAGAIRLREWYQTLVPVQPLPAVVVVDRSPGPSEAPEPSESAPAPVLETAAPSLVPTAVLSAADLGAPDSIDFVSGEVAWAVKNDTLYRTTDGGQTWSDVHPPIRPRSGKSMAVDGDTFYASGVASSSISVTHDGGATWRQADFDEPERLGSPLLAFRDAEHGSAEFRMPDPAHHVLHVYHTSDGGRTWDGPVVERLPVFSPILPGGSHLTPPAGRALWLSNGKQDGVPFDNTLLVSLDGGWTWLERRFPTGPHAHENALKWPTALWADGDGHMALAMSMGSGEKIFVSDDGGMSWRFIRRLPDLVSGKLGMPSEVALLSMTEWVWVAWDGSGSWSTTDGGQTWRQVSGPTRVVLYPFGVASADRIWAVHPCGPGAAADQRLVGPDPYCAPGDTNGVLLVTDDGGRTWVPLGS